METKDIILELRTKNGMSQDELADLFVLFDVIGIGFTFFLGGGVSFLNFWA